MEREDTRNNTESQSGYLTLNRVNVFILKKLSEYKGKEKSVVISSKWNSYQEITSQLGWYEKNK